MKPDEKDRIPLFKTWNRWYVFVIVVLAVQIVLFYLLTQHFA